MSTEWTRRDFLKSFAALPMLAMQMSAAGRAFSSMGAEEDKPNILILVFDTLSAKHTTLANYARQTTPNLARLAETSTVYGNHFAGANFTSPGTASLLTGTYPWTHRALHLHSTVLPNVAHRNLFNVFDNSYYRMAYTHNLLVAALLQQFRSALDLWKPTRELCISDSQWADRLFPEDYNIAFHSEWQLMRGSKQPSSLFASFIDRALRFTSKSAVEDQYGALFPRGVPELHSLQFVLEDVVDWLISDLAGLPQPFLSYVHVLPPHEPYATRRDFVDVFQDEWRPVEKPPYFAGEKTAQQGLNRERRKYDEYLAYADAELGRLVDGLRQDGLLDNTLLVVTSDHGELFERGIRGHVTPALYDPIIRVPLLISRPGQSERQDVLAPTSCVDVLPTLLHYTGQAVPDWCEGAILPGFGEDEPSEDRSIFALEAKSNPKVGPLKKATVAMIAGENKLVHNIGAGPNIPEFEQYDLENDPDELNDLHRLDPAMGRELREELEATLAAVGTSPDQP